MLPLSFEPTLAFSKIYHDPLEFQWNFQAVINGMAFKTENILEPTQFRMASTDQWWNLSVFIDAELTLGAVVLDKHLQHTLQALTYYFNITWECE